MADAPPPLPTDTEAALAILQDAEAAEGAARAAVEDAWTKWRTSKEALDAVLVAASARGFPGVLQGSA